MAMADVASAPRGAIAGLGAPRVPASGALGPRGPGPRAYGMISISSTSKTRVAPGLMRGGAPRSP